jgi:hypothetical protein
MQIEISQQRDRVFAGACLLLVLAVCGHIWIDELLMWVQWFIRTAVVPILGLDRYF